MKKKSQTWYRKKCVTKAKDEAKKKADYKCEKCGRSRVQGYQMHGSHIYPEGIYKSMSADADNILCLCALCHMDWHENPIRASEWFNGKYPKLAMTLRARSQIIVTINWEVRYLSTCKDQTVGI